MASIRPVLAEITGHISGVLFLRSPLFGLCVCLAMLLAPLAVLGGLLALAASFLTRWGLLPDINPLDRPAHLYNPLLTGMALASLLTPSPQSLLLCILAGMLAPGLTASLQHMLGSKGLPVMSLPFALLCLALFMAMPEQWLAQPLVSEARMSLLHMAAAYCRAMGGVFFLKPVLAGAIICLALLARSPILAMLSLLGFASGLATSTLFSGSLAMSLHDPNSFNWVLTAMALGGVFLIPSPRSLVAAGLAAAGSAVLAQALASLFQMSTAQVFTLPFNLAVLLAILAFGQAGSRHLARLILAGPEATLERNALDKRRSWTLPRPIHPPFAGEWTVFQGVDGPWTHQGIWRHAYDFVITDDSGKSHSGQGKEARDFYAYGKPVLSPMSGLVARVRDGVPDNSVGWVEQAANWGNHVVLRHELGFHVTLAHLSPHSIQVVEGQWVEAGQVLGRCGNSGYSPEPHIHLQAQAGPDPREGTLPLSLALFERDEKLRLAGEPRQGERIRALPPARMAQELALGETFTFALIHHDDQIIHKELTVGMAEDGTLYLASGQARLFFVQILGTLYFLGLEGSDTLLERIFAALPSTPPIHASAMLWRDLAPLSLAWTRSPWWKVYAGRSLALFNSEWALLHVESRTEPRGDAWAVHTRLSSPRLTLETRSRATLDQDFWIRHIACSDLDIVLLRRNSTPVQEFLPRAEHQATSPLGDTSSAPRPSLSGEHALGSHS